ncbi:glycosyltransferase family 4 protein [Saccharicrinis sp. 156]|uniref:glycosyltransferase family 4 protein n=1 Tax=Saccharicrinis sp. 156 TaxID=3417574 RepID=UPI003D34D6FE
MKILIIHNHYSKHSGEESVVYAQVDLLKKQGHEVITYYRKSSEIENMRLGKIISFFTAFYNPRSIKAIKGQMRLEKPDIVHVHNLFPLISPAVLPVIKKTGVPVVMTVHNYRLSCPNGLFFSQGSICEACTADGKEFNCIKRNCEGSYYKSIGYALRNWWARKKKYYLNNIDAFACLTQFQKQKLINAGFDPEKIQVIPNMYNGLINRVRSEGEKRKYVAFAGRISPEKGIGLLFDTANKLPHIQFKLAGAVREGYNLPDKPENVELVGMLDKEELKLFYNHAYLYLLSSIWYEGFPMVFPEAMNYSLPIIAPNMAGFPEIVEDNFNGLLFDPGNVKDLANKIEYLYDNPNIARGFGKNGYKKLQDLYTPDIYYKSLIALYQSLIKK